MSASRRAELGDFQTPATLAHAVCAQVAASGFVPAAIVEPTCGLGNLLFGALDQFPAVKHALGLELQPEHAASARTRGCAYPHATICEADFFTTDWDALLAKLPDPLLVIGNPPWATNAMLSVKSSANLPQKSNTRGMKGLDALTGRSNFDISESMLLRMMALLRGRNAMLAVLCKTSVARKVLEFGWENAMPWTSTCIKRIDAGVFDAAVDACLLMCHFGKSAATAEAPVFASLDATQPESVLGLENGRLLSNVAAWRKWQHLDGVAEPRWRSGIKHDCAAILELTEQVDGTRVNGLDESVEVDDETLFPLLKSSDLGSDTPRTNGKRWLIVPQRTTGDDTSILARTAPLTFAYLRRHGDRLDARASVIYRSRPRFSIFGIGDYAFAPWKVGISGLYKRFSFRLIAPQKGQPVMTDDTCYILPFHTQETAELALKLLQHPSATAFLTSQVFWDSKRPITADLLNRLDLSQVAKEAGMTKEWAKAIEWQPSMSLPYETLPLFATA